MDAEGNKQHEESSVIPSSFKAITKKCINNILPSGKLQHEVFKKHKML